MSRPSVQQERKSVANSNEVTPNESKNASLTQAELVGELFPSHFGTGPKGGLERDQSIKDLEKVHRKLHKLGIIKECALENNAPGGAEHALLVCRRLDQTGKEPSDDNIRAASQDILDARRSVEQVTAIGGKRVAVVAHNEVLFNGHKPKSTCGFSDLAMEISGDYHAFGKEKFIESLKNQVGEGGSVELVRASNLEAEYEEHLQHVLQRNESLLLEIARLRGASSGSAQESFRTVQDSALNLRTKIQREMLFEPTLLSSEEIHNNKQVQASMQKFEMHLGELLQNPDTASEMLKEHFSEEERPFAKEALEKIQANQEVFQKITDRHLRNISSDVASQYYSALSYLVDNPQSMGVVLESTFTGEELKRARAAAIDICSNVQNIEDILYDTIGREFTLPKIKLQANTRLPVSVAPNQAWGYIDYQDEKGQKLLAYHMHLKMPEGPSEDSQDKISVEAQIAEPYAIGMVSIARSAEQLKELGSKHDHLMRDVKQRAFEQVRNAKPGPEGFTLYWDGHSTYEHLAFSGGVPERTSEGLVIKFNPEHAISADELATAIIERSKNFPKQEGQKPDVYLFGGCLSGNFITKVADKVAEAGCDVPVIVASTERNMLMTGEVENPVGNKFAEFVLAPGDDVPRYEVNVRNGAVGQAFSFKNTWDKTEDLENHRPANFEDYFRALKENPVNAAGNPSIIVPTKKGKGWIQVSDVRGSQRLGIPKLLA